MCDNEADLSCCVAVASMLEGFFSLLSVSELESLLQHYFILQDKVCKLLSKPLNVGSEAFINDVTSFFEHVHAIHTVSI